MKINESTGTDATGNIQLANQLIRELESNDSKRQDSNSEILETLRLILEEVKMMRGVKDAVL